MSTETETEVWRQRWDVCNECGCATVVSNIDSPEGVPDPEEWDDGLPSCYVCGGSLTMGNADPDTTEDQWRERLAAVVAAAAEAREEAEQESMRQAQTALREYGELSASREAVLAELAAARQEADENRGLSYLTELIAARAELAAVRAALADTQAQLEQLRAQLDEDRIVEAGLRSRAEVAEREMNEARAAREAAVNRAEVLAAEWADTEQTQHGDIAKSYAAQLLLAALAGSGA